MVKARVGARLKVAVGSKKMGGDEQLFSSRELTDLTFQYKEFSKRLGQLIANTRAHNSALLALSNTSIAVANDIVGLAQNSPLAETVGKPAKTKDDTAEDTGEGTNGTTAGSAPTFTFLSIQQSVATNLKRSRANYGRMVLDYLVQWESAVTTRVNADLKTEEQLRVELVHYESKVQALQQQVESTLAKGKRPKDELNEKLSRNTDKLEESREQYQVFVTNLCSLLDEIVHRSWRDLQPVLLEMARHDIQLSVDQAKTMQQLKSIIIQVKTIGKEHSVPLSGRLAELKDLTHKDLSTTADVTKNEGNTEPEQLPAGGSKQSDKQKAANYAEANPHTTNTQVDLNDEFKVSKREGTHSQFYVACATGDEGYLQMVVKNDETAVNQHDEEGMTPLGIAARCGHTNCIQFLLERGARVNDPDRKGCSPLHHASEMGFEGCVEILLDHEAAVDAVDGEGFTPLHLACEQGHGNIAKLLMEKGASVDASNSDSWRPIHLAAQKGHLDCLELLIQSGAMVTKKEGDPWTSLHLAAAGGFQDCLKVLLEAGAYVDDVDRSGSTPLQKASEKAYLECVRVLLNNKADPNKMDDEGYTPLIATALEGDFEIMNLLLFHGADVDEAHPNGWTPLHLAADYGFPQCIELLLKHGANPDAKNEDGWTALHKAAEQGNYGCLDILLANGADLEASNNDGFRALHVASFNGRADCVELLLDRNAQIDQQDGNGCTALFWAASEGHLECAEVLIDRSANATIPDGDGNTPAQAAAMNGHAECAKLFK